MIERERISSGLSRNQVLVTTDMYGTTSGTYSASVSVGVELVCPLLVPDPLGGTEEAWVGGDGGVSSPCVSCLCVMVEGRSMCVLDPCRRYRPRHECFRSDWTV